MSVSLSQRSFAGSEEAVDALNQSGVATSARSGVLTVRDASDVLVKAQTLLSEIQRRGGQSTTGVAKSLIALCERSVDIAKDLQSRSKVATGSGRVETKLMATFDSVGGSAPS